MPGPLGRASMWGAVIEVPLGCRHFPSDFYATTVGNEPWINLSFYDIPACWEQSKHDKTILAKLVLEIASAFIKDLHYALFGIK